jgi:hypothetical protein
MDPCKSGHLNNHTNADGRHVKGGLPAIIMIICIIKKQLSQVAFLLCFIEG